MVSDAQSSTVKTLLTRARWPVSATQFSDRAYGAYFADLAVAGAERVAALVCTIAVASSNLVSLEFSPGHDSVALATLPADGSVHSPLPS